MRQPEEIRVRELARTELFAFRTVAAVAFTQLAVGLLLLGSDPGYPRGRIAAIAVCAILTVVIGGVELLYRPISRGQSARMILPVVNIAVFTVLVASGEGLSGPLAPLLFHVPLGLAARLGRRPAVVAAIGATLVAIAVLALLPPSVTGPSLAEPQRSACFAVMLGGVMLSLSLEVGGVRRAYARAARQLDVMREEVLHGHEAEVREIEATGARVAHELKNPLTSIKSLLALELEEAPEEGRRRRLEVVAREVERMRTILQDYLTFSRPRGQLRLSKVDVHGLAQGVVEVLAARAHHAGVQVQVEGERTVVTGDGHRLRGALLNFIGNAVEATPRGGRVAIEIASTADQVSLLVRDSGRGLAGEDLARVGTPFFTTKDGGTGLGVAVAKGTIEQHGGTIVYDSVPGSGTTLRIRLPRVAPVDEALTSYESLAHLEEQVEAFDRQRSEAQSAEDEPR